MGNSLGLKFMAAPIVTTASTLEEQFIEVASALAIIDRAAVAADPTKPDRVQVTVNFDAKTVGIGALLPAVIESEGTGFSVIADEIYP